jgi:hypothetical protein
LEEALEHPEKENQEKEECTVQEDLADVVVAASTGGGEFLFPEWSPWVFRR